jgi:hypothetical protein
LPVPYARRPANTPRQIGKLDAQLLGTAMKILQQAVARSRGQAVATLEVRLALLVVHRYVRDRELVRRFWQRASLSSRNVNEGLADPLHAISKRLELLGWIAPAVLLERTRTWPWNSPAPPGWMARPDDPRSAKPDNPDPS